MAKSKTVQKITYMWHSGSKVYFSKFFNLLYEDYSVKLNKKDTDIN